MSPAKIRRLVNATLRPPALSPLFEKVPPASEITGELLLQFHAQTLLGSGLFAPCALCRYGVKKPLPTRLLLERLVADGGADLARPPLSWTERRHVGHFVATVYAHHYGTTVRQARQAIKECWQGMSGSCRVNWWLLSQRVAPPGPKPESLRDRAKDQEVETYGALLTWQSKWGRQPDVAQQLFANGVTQEDQCEILRRDPLARQAFEIFADWISATAKHLGFERWSAAMELNSDTAAKNKLHFHAHMARDWRLWKKPTWSKVSFRPARVVFDCHEAHVALSNVRANQNPTEILTSGLYYQPAPEKGSVFSAGNGVVGQDAGAAR